MTTVGRQSPILSFFCHTGAPPFRGGKVSFDSMLGLLIVDFNDESELLRRRGSSNRCVSNYYENPLRFTRCASGGRRRRPQSRIPKGRKSKPPQHKSRRS